VQGNYDPGLGKSSVLVTKLFKDPTAVNGYNMTDITQNSFISGFSFKENLVNFLSWKNYTFTQDPPGSQTSLWTGLKEKYSSEITSIQTPMKLESYNDSFTTTTQPAPWFNGPTCQYTEDDTSFCYTERPDQQVLAFINNFNSNLSSQYIVFNTNTAPNQTITNKCHYKYVRVLSYYYNFFLSLDPATDTLLVCGYDPISRNFSNPQVVLTGAKGYSVVSQNLILAFNSTVMFELGFSYSGNPISVRQTTRVIIHTLNYLTGEVFRDVKSGYFYNNSNASYVYSILRSDYSEDVYLHHRPARLLIPIVRWLDIRRPDYAGSPFIHFTNFGSLAVVFQNVINNNMVYAHFKTTLPGLGSASVCPSSTCLFCWGSDNKCVHCVNPAQIPSGTGCIDKPPPPPPPPAPPAPCVLDPGKLECLVYLPPFNYTFTYYQPNIREPIIFLRLLFKDGDKYLTEALQLDNNLHINFRVEFSLCAGSGQSFNFLNSFKLDDRRLQIQLNLTDSCKENLKAFYLADDSTKTETIRLVQVNNKTKYFNIGTGNPDMKISSTETRYLLGKKMSIASIGPITTEMITDQSNLFGFLAIIVILVNLVNSTCFGVNFVSMAFKSSLTLKIIYQLRLIDVYKGNTLTYFEKNFFKSFQDKPGFSNLIFYFRDYRYKLFMEKFNTFAFGMCFYRILSCIGILALIIFIRRRYTDLFRYYMKELGPQYFVTTTNYFGDGGNSSIQDEKNIIKDDSSYLDSLVPEEQHATKAFRMMLRLYLFKFTYSLEFIGLAILFQGVWIYALNDMIHWRYGPGNKLSFSNVFCLTFSLFMVLFLGYQMARLFRLSTKTVLTAVKQKQTTLLQMIGSLTFDSTQDVAMYSIDQDENNEIELEFKNGRLVREVDYSFYYARFREFEYRQFFLNGINDNIPINATFSVHFNSIYFCYFIIFQASNLGMQMLPSFQLILISFTTSILIVVLIRAHFYHRMLKYPLTFYKMMVFCVAILCHLILLLMYSLVTAESNVRFEYYKPPIYKGIIPPALGENLEFGVIVLILLSVLFELISQLFEICKKIKSSRNLKKLRKKAKLNTFDDIPELL